MSKIALCFLTYGNLSQPELWSRLLAGSRARTLCSAYIHSKTDFCDPEFGLDAFCLPAAAREPETQYGHISLVRATLRLMRYALEDCTDNAYFVLLSDTCIPIRPLADIHAAVHALGSCLLHDYHYTYADRHAALEDSTLFPRDRFSTQSQWMVLDRATAHFFADPANDFTSLFGDRTWAPDETYFVNFMRKFHMPFINHRTHVLRFLPTGRPFTYGAEDTDADADADADAADTLDDARFREIQNCAANVPCFFLRKVDARCALPPAAHALAETS